MRWYYKIAGIAFGIFLAFIVVSAVVGFVLGLVLKVAIAALVVGGVVYAVKRARSGRQVPGKKADREVREPEYSRPLPRADVDHGSAPFPPPARPAAQDVDDDLARLKREMGSLA